MASPPDGNRHRALTMTVTPAGAIAAVLLLHGGRAHGRDRPPSPWGGPAVRMIPFAGAIGRAVRGHRVALGRVRYRFRGWNDDHADPAVDARAALDDFGNRFGPLPVVLVGHSMGGRAALRVADHPLVRAVVGLAPWCPPGEPVERLAGRRVVLLHCPTDRVTDPEGSWELVRRARAAGAEAAGLAVPRGGHAMLRGAAEWHRLTADAVAGLLDLRPLPPRTAAALAADAGVPFEDGPAARSGQSASRARRNRSSASPRSTSGSG